MWEEIIISIALVSSALVVFALVKMSGLEVP
jgi:hypothetical protein